MFDWLRKMWADRKVETRIQRDATSEAEKARIDERWKLIQSKLKEGAK